MSQACWGDWEIHCIVTRQTSYLHGCPEKECALIASYHDHQLKRHCCHAQSSLQCLCLWLCAGGPKWKIWHGKAVKVTTDCWHLVDCDYHVHYISAADCCVHTPCPKKTCDYNFYNNFNNKCPITIIFGIVSIKSLCHRKLHLTYLVQLPYLGKLQNTKNGKFRRKQHIVLWINNVKQYFIYT